MTRRTPLWIRGRSDDSFKADLRRPCLDRHEYFDNSIEALAVCQSLCVNCPVFQDCTRWTLANYDRQPYFTYAGMSERVRARINAGEPYYDWRRDWNKRHRRYTKRRADEIYRVRYRSGRSKRAQAKAEMPPCPICLNHLTVNRSGRDRDSHQRYHCTSCKKTFQGEQL
jgi:hypothetical protein